jgi:hypothetical protein
MGSRWICLLGQSCRRRPWGGGLQALVSLFSADPACVCVCACMCVCARHGERLRKSDGAKRAKH